MEFLPTCLSSFLALLVVRTVLSLLILILYDGSIVVIQLISQIFHQCTDSGRSPTIRHHCRYFPLFRVVANSSTLSFCLLVFSFLLYLIDQPRRRTSVVIRSVEALSVVGISIYQQSSRPNFFIHLLMNATFIVPLAASRFVQLFLFVFLCSLSFSI